MYYTNILSNDIMRYGKEGKYFYHDIAISFRTLKEQHSQTTFEISNRPMAPHSSLRRQRRGMDL